MLCRRRDGGCFAAALLIGRHRRMLRRCGAASSGGCLATLWLFSWSQSAASVMLFFYVGSSMLGRLVGLGGLVCFSLPFCGRRSASSVAICFRWPFFSFSLLLVICVLVQVNSCFGQHQVMSVICFPLNEIHAKARSQKKYILELDLHPGTN